MTTAAHRLDGVAITRCSRCDADLVWAVTVDGKRLPIEFTDVPDGAYYLDPPADGDTAPLARPVTGGLFEPASPRYRSHADVCDAAEWSKR